MHIDELTGSLIAHESRMNRYDDTPLENDFKSQLNVTKGRGRGRASNIEEEDEVLVIVTPETIMKMKRSHSRIFLV